MAKRILFINLTNKVMTLAHRKTKLPNFLSSLLLRRAAIFMRGLILADEGREDPRLVKNYDQQCEGAHILVSYFKNKLQFIKFKAFNALADSGQEPVPNLVVNEAKVVVGNGTTRRSNLNTTFTHSDVSPIKQMLPHPIISENELSFTDHIITPQQGRSPSKRLTNLLNKVKNINSSCKA